MRRVLRVKEEEEGTRENTRRMKSSRDAHTEETLKMSEFITISAKKERTKSKEKKKADAEIVKK